MQIPVVIEPIGDGQFRAQSFPPFPAVADGSTRDEAVSKVQAEVNKQVEQGKQVVMVEVAAKEENPWLAMAGWLKDDPLYDEWQAEMKAYRKQCDIEEGIETDDQP
jgi:hypothetical protein